MELLFKTTEEVKELAGFLYATTEFDDLKTDLEIATEDVFNIVGESVYERAVKSYSGLGSGSGSGSGSADVDRDLVRLFQHPIALLAVLSFSENTDVSHEADGRKVKIQKDSETIPWQWMLQKDSEAILRKANRAIDRLIAFLDKNVEKVDEWKNGDVRKDMLNLFIPSAAIFEDIVPIDRSRSFFLRLLPFIRKEDDELRVVLGESRYTQIKSAMKDPSSLSDQDKKVISLCREIIAPMCMAKAVRRFSVQMLPNAVVQRFEATGQSQKNSLPASQQAIAAIERIYKEDATKATGALVAWIKKNGETPYVAPEPTDYSKEKFFSA